MKTIKGMVLGLVGISSINATAMESMSWYMSPSEIFEIQAPVDWARTDEPKYLQIASPGEATAITAQAYSSSGGTIEDFFEYRQSSVEEFYKQVDAVTKIKNGFVAEYEGTWPGESKPTYYVVAATSDEGAFFSVNIVSSREEMQSSRELYYRILESVRLAHNN